MFSFVHTGWNIFEKKFHGKPNKLLNVNNNKVLLYYRGLG